MNAPLAPETVNDLASGFQGIHRIGLLVVSLLLMAAILELVRRAHLKERYALLWLAASGAVLLIGLFPDIIVGLSNALHFQYLTLVFVLSFTFLLILVLLFTVVISRLSDHNRRLAQEVALLKQQIESILKKQHNNGGREEEHE